MLVPRHDETTNTDPLQQAAAPKPPTTLPSDTCCERDSTVPNLPHLHKDLREGEKRVQQVREKSVQTRDKR